ncbi:MAG: hypothetical protein K2M46_13430 [Lachnospiraceae bacterium]|nr:hypothetical protein [Lachnospiraceae bacterium]
MRNVNSVFEMIIKYCSGFKIPLLFLLCMLFLFWWNRKNKKELVYGFLMIALGILVVFNDFSYGLLGKLTDPATLYRFCWAVPVLAVIGYVCVKLVQKCNRKWQKAAFLLLFCFFLWKGFDTYLTSQKLLPADSLEKISAEVEDVGKIIQEHKQEEHPICVFDLELQMRIRVKEPDIVWCVPRSKYMYFIDNGFETGKYKYYARLVQAVNYGEEIPSRQLRRALKKKKVEFVVLKREYWREGYWEGVGATLVMGTENYLIYQFISEEINEQKTE